MYAAELVYSSVASGGSHELCRFMKPSCPGGWLHVGHSLTVFGTQYRSEFVFVCIVLLEVGTVVAIT